MSDEKPAEKPTVELEKPPSWAIALAEKVADGFQRVDARFDAVEANQELQGGQVRDLGQRMTSIESRVQRVETGSIRAKADTANEVNLKQDAAIAQIIVKVDDLAVGVDHLTTKTNAQTAMLATIEKHATNLLSSPKVKALSWALWLALAGWLASKGIKVGP